MACESGQCECEGCDVEMTDEDVASLRRMNADEARSEYEPRFSEALRILADVTSEAVAQVGEDSPEALRFGNTLTNLFQEYENHKANDDFWLSSEALTRFGNRITLAIDSVRAEAASSTFDDSWYSDWKTLVASLYNRTIEIGGKVGDVVGSALPTASWIVWGVAAVLVLYYLGPAAGSYARRKAA